MVEEFDEKSCGIILFREGKSERLFLLLHYPSGHWDFPKGHVEQYDKTEQDTAKRELLEETGISQVEILDGYREPMNYTYLRDKKPSNKQVIFFLAKTGQEDVTISHEHFDFDWLPYDVAYNRLTFDNAKNLLKKASAVIMKLP